MNKKVEFILSCIGLIALIAIAVFGYRFLTQNNESTNISQRKEGGGNIMKITSENFESEVLNSDKPVIIDFYADWCGPCKMLAPIMEEISEENEDIKIVKIDVDSEQELSMKYGVQSIPTIVAIKNGETVKTLVGLRAKEEILDMVK